MSGRIKTLDKDGPTKIIIEIVKATEGEVGKKARSIVAARRLYITREGRDIKIAESNGAEAKQKVKMLVVPFIKNFLQPSIIQHVLHSKKMSVGEKIDFFNVPSAQGPQDITKMMGTYFGLHSSLKIDEAWIRLDKVEDVGTKKVGRFRVELRGGPYGENSQEHYSNTTFLIDLSNLAILQTKTEKETKSVTRFNAQKVNAYEIWNYDSVELVKDVKIGESKAHKVEMARAKAINKILESRVFVPQSPPNGEVSLCDELAAHPNDPSKAGKGTKFRKMNARAARMACEQALEDDPGNARYIMNLGRAFNKLKNYDESFRLTKAASDAGYPYAHHSLGLHYYYGEGAPKSAYKEKGLVLKAAEAGVAISWKRSAMLELKKSPSNIDFIKVARYIKRAQQHGLELEGVRGNYHYQKAKKMTHSSMFERDASNLKAKDLRTYRNHMLQAEKYYKKHLKKYPKDNKTVKRYGAAKYQLSAYASEKDIRKRERLDKVLSGNLELPKKLVFKDQVGTSSALKATAGKWKMLGSDGEIGRSSFRVSGSRAYSRGMFSEDKTPRTPEEM